MKEIKVPISSMAVGQVIPVCDVPAGAKIAYCPRLGLIITHPDQPPMVVRATGDSVIIDTIDFNATVTGVGKAD